MGVIGEDAPMSRVMDSGPVPAASSRGSLEHLHASSLVSKRPMRVMVMILPSESHCEGS